MSNQNINRNPGIKWAIFNFKRAKGMDCFDYLNSLYYFTFLWQWICKKALWRMYPYSWIFPSPHACKCAFSWDTFPPFKYMYLMDDPIGQLFEKILCETLCEKTVCERMFGHHAFKRKTWNTGMSFLNQQQPNCAKDIFFRKTIDIIFMYLLILFISQTLKKTGKVHPELWRHVIFGPKMTNLRWRNFFQINHWYSFHASLGPFNCRNY